MSLAQKAEARRARFAAKRARNSAQGTRTPPGGHVQANTYTLNARTPTRTRLSYR